MEARKLLYMAMALAPVILAGSIGVHARTFEDPFEWTDTASDQVRINAYLPLVKTTDANLTSRSSATEAETLRLADSWIAGANEGQLKPLVPIAADELAPNGVKNDIFQSQFLVCRRLTEFSDLHSSNGEDASAALDLTKAVQVANVLKYSNFMHLYRCSLLQFKCVERIESIYPNLDANSQSNVRAQLAKIRKYNGKLALMTSRTRSVVLEAMQEKATITRAHKAVDLVVPSTSYFEDRAMARVRPDASLTLVDLGLRIPSQYSSADRTIEIDQELRLKIQRILSLKRDRM
jgi:hypothetical protein